MDCYENSNKHEVAILISVDDGSFDAESSLAELRLLAATAGAEVFCTVCQKKEKPDAGTYIGSGRLEEICAICDREDIDLLIFDGELTPTQQRNLENITDVRVVDRTTLILDIFALNAKSKEGKLQVELAQLNYMLPRLTGRGTAMSRLGGGIGTRGPGESKLESDRRHIRRRIHSLETELKNTEKQRRLRRNKRKNDGIITAAIVGYTNAGKSTLLNMLTNAGVLAEDKLFATLDPTSRALKLPDGRTVMLIDTVGFISRLPHSLVEAFKSTLEEAANADIILNVCDASSPELDRHIDVTEKILNELGAENTPTVTVLNKCDKCTDFMLFPFGKKSVRISALTGDGIDRLLRAVTEILPDSVRRVNLLIPYSDGSAPSAIRNLGKVIAEEFTEQGIKITADIDIKFLNRFSKFIADNQE